MKMLSFLSGLRNRGHDKLDGGIFSGLKRSKTITTVSSETGIPAKNFNGTLRDLMMTSSHPSPL